MRLRKITPTECERLQGFEDGWTDVKYNGKPMPDTARYRMLGNSMAVNCMEWIGERINYVEGLISDQNNYVGNPDELNEVEVKNES